MEVTNQTVTNETKPTAGTINLAEVKGNVSVTTNLVREEKVSYSSKLSLDGATPEDDEIITKTRAEYVIEFKRGVEKTARSTLEMCRVVYEASRTLDGFQFKTFCSEIGFKDYSSTVRKFTVIGKLYPRLVQYADQLPSTWTNIYLITQIPADTFEECIREGLSLNKLSGSKLDELVKSTRQINEIHRPLAYDKKNSGYTFGKMLFTKVPDDTDWRAMEKALSELSARLPIKFSINKQTADIVYKRRNQRYEKTKKVYNGIEMRPDLWDLGKEANAIYEDKK